MRVVVTGAGGFIGRHLVDHLIRRGRLAGPDGRPAAIEELVLFDAAPTAPPEGGRIRVTTMVGDLAEPSVPEALLTTGVASIFHLAAVLTTSAEAEFRRGLEVNVLAFIRLLERCRTALSSPRLVFASSIATFGGPLPEIVDDDWPQTPTTSYGTHKVIAERLIDDYSRRGLVDGRALRLPVVLIRPDAGPLTARRPVSDLVAAIPRDILLGREAVSPLPAALRVPVCSAAAAAKALADLHDVPGEALGHPRALNLPSLTVSVADMAEAARRAAPRGGGIAYAVDPAIERIVAGWPPGFRSARASRLGIAGDGDFAAICAHFLADRDGRR